MSTTARHGFTSHGHHCCDLAPVGERPNRVVRCGGLRLCGNCQQSAADLHEASGMSEPTAPVQPADLKDMERAVKFAAYLLRTEQGAGGITVDMPVAERNGWNEAIEHLEDVLCYPMIPLHFWRAQRREPN